MIKHHGFTLVELLVAIAIFAILAAMGWNVFEHISHVKERNVIREFRVHNNYIIIKYLVVINNRR